MNVFGLRAFLRSPNQLIGGQRYNAWAAAAPAASARVAEDFLLGLYTNGAHAPSVPMSLPNELPHPPDDVRRAVLAVPGHDAVTIIYDEWMTLRLVRLLYIEGGEAPRNATGTP